MRISVRLPQRRSGVGDCVGRRGALMSDAQHGECLCGRIKVTLSAPVDHVEACHCPMCLRWCGGPFLTIHAPEGSTVSGDTLTVYRSSFIAERAFCSLCGSNVFYRFRDGPELMLSAGMFDTSGFVLSREIFHDRKPAFYEFTGETDKLTGLQSALQWLPVIVFRRAIHLFGLNTR